MGVAEERGGARGLVQVFLSEEVHTMNRVQTDCHIKESLHRAPKLFWDVSQFAVVRLPRRTVHRQMVGGVHAVKLRLALQV